MTGKASHKWQRNATWDIMNELERALVSIYLQNTVEDKDKLVVKAIKAFAEPNMYKQIKDVFL